ncbi:uncharacterized protein LOC124163332 isoform X2 [Ischnura elegans]|uniref:uncharacterized protein LOC124163332 isoform X2 n=1 Tax=Ischnura elegans TaxID=197161 RepID=UPI001ED873BA|nr:uncharacterized protein LOC124163332 isoform X2 [Ischnura elegans]
MERSTLLAGYVPVHEPSLGRTGVRGRKTVVLWALVLLLFAMAAANLCLTLTILGVLRVGHGMEAIEFLSELGIMKFRGIADLDRVTKRDGRIQGFAGSPVEISGDGGSVLFDLGASVGPRISLDEEGISMTGLESLDVLLHGASRGSLHHGGGPPRGSPATVFSTRYPNFGLPRGVRRLDVASATAKRLSAPVGASLRLKSTSRVRLRGSEGAVLDGRELAWSADQDILLRSVNGSILLNGTNGVALDVRSVPLVPLPPPNHVAMMRRMRAAGSGERGADGSQIASNDGNPHLKERKLKRVENLHHRNYFQPQNMWMESGNEAVTTAVRRLKTRRLRKAGRQVAGEFKRMPFGTLRGHAPLAFPVTEVQGALGEALHLPVLAPWASANASRKHSGAVSAPSRLRRGGAKVGARPQFKVCVCMPGGRLFRVPWSPSGCLNVAEQIHILPPAMNPCL